MSLFINNSQEETFQILNDFFNGRRYKILCANAPSLVRAEFGSFMALSVSTGTAKGEAEAIISKGNNGSYVNLHFNFMKEYISGLIGATLCALLAYGIGYWSFSSVIPSVIPINTSVNAWSIFNTLMPLLCILAFVFIMLIEGYYISRTKKRFITEFDNFAKSLQNNKFPPPPPP